MSALLWSNCQQPHLVQEGRASGVRMMRSLVNGTSQAKREPAYNDVSDEAPIVPLNLRV